MLHLNNFSSNFALQIQGGHDHVYITDDLCKYGFYHYTHHLSGHYTNVPVSLHYNSLFFRLK